MGSALLMRCTRIEAIVSEVLCFIIAVGNIKLMVKLMSELKFWVLMNIIKFMISIIPK